MAGFNAQTVQQKPPQERTDKGLYLLRVNEPGYDVVVRERERGEKHSTLEVKGLVPTVTAGGTVMAKAVFEIAKERGFAYTFSPPPPEGSTNAAVRGPEGRQLNLTAAQLFGGRSGGAPRPN